MRLKATVDTIANFFEKEFADIRHQSSWDNSGKQVYMGNIPVTKVCLALDPSKSVINQAINRGCELLITHHPLFFTPQKGLNNTYSKDALVIHAIKNNLNILSYHTNLDMAKEGLSTYIVRLMEAEPAEPLDSEGEIPHSLLSVYVPKGHENKVLDALADAGAGNLGNYNRCAFSVSGTGTFIPTEAAHPFIGTAGQTELVEETRIDMLLPNDKITEAIQAIRSSHPYEEPAYYIVPTKSPEMYGFGQIGHFKQAIPFHEFVQHLKKQLGVRFISTNIPDYATPVKRFAVITGSGASEWKACLKSGIDLLITGDMKHHDALDAREAGVCILDAGHFATEKIFMNYLAGLLEKRFDTETITAQETSTVNIIE